MLPYCESTASSRPGPPITEAQLNQSRVAPAEDARLTPARMSVYATGDFTVNTVLVSLNMVFVTYFLVQVAGLRPELAGLVQLIGRGVDAFTDPAMGRISDLSRWRWGRRRPFLLLGALPFGLAFALLWTSPLETQAAMFVYYTTLYVLLSLSMTVLAVPYLALMPEMALGYDARTRINMYRNVGSIAGLAAGAVGFHAVAEGLGGNGASYAFTGALCGVLIFLPWMAVYAATWERADYQSREAGMTLIQGVRLLARHHNFLRVTGLYLCSRIAMDLVGAMLILYMLHVMGRSGDFPIAMGLFLAAVMLSLPFWWIVSKTREKRNLFMFGAAWWMLSFGPFLFAESDWPRWLVLAFVPIGGIGFAVVDLMAWAMLTDVVDEDDILTGERREGVYYGAFMFVRKLGGSLAVFIAMQILGAAGYARSESNAAQSESVVTMIRWLTALGPAIFLALSLWLARNYALSRSHQSAIRARLEARDGIA
jgi:GPH family glycoside/pentoside/hexuronide:cation symporter